MVCILSDNKTVPEQQEPDFDFVKMNVLQIPAFRRFNRGCPIPLPLTKNWGINTSLKNPANFGKVQEQL